MGLMTLVAALAVWRLTHLMHAEDGPFLVFARLRQAAASTPFSEAFDCFYCLSLWVAAPVALLLGGAPRELLVSWLALSGGAILLERLTTPLPTFHEERAPFDADAPADSEQTLREHSEMESLDVLLRKDA
ncbi:MAG: hypothetical protein ABW252_12010 [Polyangiales bacterium]